MREMGVLTGKTTRQALCEFCDQRVPGVEQRVRTSGGQVAVEWRLADHKTPGCGKRCLGVDMSNCNVEHAQGCFSANPDCEACSAERQRNPRQLSLDDITNPGFRYTPEPATGHA